MNSCQFLYKNFFLFSRGRKNCECSCIIINCNRMLFEHSQFAISMQIRWLAVTAKCHCRSIKTDDLQRCLMRWPCALSQWCDSIFYFWFFRFVSFYFISFFLLTQHNIYKNPWNCVQLRAAHIYLNAVALIDSVPYQCAKCGRCNGRPCRMSNVTITNKRRRSPWNLIQALTKSKA